MQHKPTTVFVIREKATGKLIKFGSKCAWATIGAAKTAFSLHMQHYIKGVFWGEGVGLFDSQEDFVIEEIS